MDRRTPRQQAFDYFQVAQMSQANVMTTSQDLSPLSYYDPQADFSTESAPSRGSPISPSFTNSFQVSSGTEWPGYYDKPTLSPDLDALYEEAFGSPVSFTLQPQNLALSPVESPIDFMTDSVPFGQGGLNDNRPLFEIAQSSPVVSHRSVQSAKALPTAAHGPKTARATHPRSREEKPARFGSSHQSGLLKRKSSSSESLPSLSPEPEPASRRTKHTDPSRNPHNMIEKRYRVNINEKIVALRDAVPSLRVVKQQLENPDLDEEYDIVQELGGLMPARKLNKATILSKATEYIAHLEKKNTSLAKENEALEKRLADVGRWQQTENGSGAFWS